MTLLDDALRRYRSPEDKLLYVIRLTEDEVLVVYRRAHELCPDQEHDALGLLVTSFVWRATCDYPTPEQAQLN